MGKLDLIIRKIDSLSKRVEKLQQVHGELLEYVELSFSHNRDRIEILIKELKGLKIISDGFSNAKYQEELLSLEVANDHLAGSLELVTYTRSWILSKKYYNVHPYYNKGGIDLHALYEG
nr:hypothetical protein [Ganoderma leucocontextum]